KHAHALACTREYVPKRRRSAVRTIQESNCIFALDLFGKIKDAVPARIYTCYASTPRRESHRRVHTMAGHETPPRAQRGQSGQAPLVHPPLAQRRFRAIQSNQQKTRHSRIIANWRGFWFELRRAE